MISGFVGHCAQKHGSVKANRVTPAPLVVLLAITRCLSNTEEKWTMRIPNSYEGMMARAMMNPDQADLMSDAMTGKMIASHHMFCPTCGAILDQRGVAWLNLTIPAMDNKPEHERPLVVCKRCDADAIVRFIEVSKRYDAPVHYVGKWWEKKKKAYTGQRVSIQIKHRGKLIASAKAFERLCRKEMVQLAKQISRKNKFDTVYLRLAWLDYKWNETAEETIELLFEHGKQVD